MQYEDITPESAAADPAGVEVRSGARPYAPVDFVKLHSDGETITFRYADGGTFTMPLSHGPRFRRPVTPERHDYERGESRHPMHTDPLSTTSEAYDRGVSHGWDAANYADGTKREEDNDTRQPIPDTPFYRSMREGHATRKGHALGGYLVVRDNGLAELVRTCCKSEV